MAAPLNPIEAFLWGQGGVALSPEQVARDREIASLLMRDGADYSPVQHWSQGLARMAQGWLGGRQAYQAREGERAGREAFTSRPEYASVFGGAGAATSAAPLVSQGEASVPAIEAANAVAQAAPSDVGGAGWLNYANTGATRNRPISPALEAALSFLPELGVTMEVFSGGQPGIDEGGGRVGSTRHDHGNAADVFFYRDGRQLDWANPDDLSVFEEIVRRARASGVTGFGAGEGYMRPGSMHIGFGPEAVWGAGGSGENAPEWLRNAFYGAPAGTAPSGAGGVPMQQPQAPQQQAGYDIASLLSLAADPWANDSERQIVQALLSQEMQRQAQENDPLRQIQIQQARLQLERDLNPFQAAPATPEQLAQWGIQPQPGESWTIGPDGLPQQVYAAPGAPQPVFEGGQWWDTSTGVPTPLTDPRQDPTSGIQEYEYYVSQALANGQTPVSFDEWDLERRGRGATQISIAGQGQQDALWGDAPNDQVWLRDESGQVITEPDPSGRGVRPVSVPIAGSALDLQTQAAEFDASRQRDVQAVSDAQSASNTLADVAAVREIIENADTPATGTLSIPFAMFSGTPAGRVRSYVGTLQSSVALGAMQRLKEASATGATGFGALSAPELNLLISDLGALNPDTTEPDIFIQTLDRIESNARFVADDIRRNVSPERIEELGLTSFLSMFDPEDEAGQPEAGASAGAPVDQYISNRYNQNPDRYNSDTPPPDWTGPVEFWPYYTPEERAAWQ